MYGTLASHYRYVRARSLGTETLPEVLRAAIARNNTVLLARLARTKG